MDSLVAGKRASVAGDNSGLDRAVWEKFAAARGNLPKFSRDLQRLAVFGASRERKSAVTVDTSAGDTAPGEILGRIAAQAVKFGEMEMLMVYAPRPLDGRGNISRKPVGRAGVPRAAFNCMVPFAYCVGWRRSAC